MAQRRQRLFGYSRRGLCCCLASLVCSGLVSHAHAADAKRPSDVEAAFLLNFTRFVGWSAVAFDGPDSPLTICILGEDPFGGAIDQLVEGESANGRRIAVERINHMPPPHKCQVIFFGRSEKNVAATLRELGPGVLTVSDRDNFISDGGMIEFLVEAGHVRFDIHQRAATNANLVLNARLLQVARTVRK
jgi:hypothetical protein